jgi:aryl-alcohol dehydrogenase-like predicted oxidoreductase
MVLDASLKRLNIDTIDLYQLHGWDPLTPVEETVRFLDDAVHAGKIRYAGLSNFLDYQIQEYVDLADALNLASRPVAVQPQYNLLSPRRT